MARVGKPDRAPSVARRAAEQLRAIILEKESGAYLGSQDELVLLLGVGRVTLHQAARLLESERLLEVRRGVNGGYFGARPDIEIVERAVMIYLHEKEISFATILRTSSALLRSLVGQAATASDVRREEKIPPVLSLYQGTNVEHTFETLWSNELAFLQAIFDLAENPFGELMIRISFKQYAETPLPIIATIPAYQAFRKLRFQLLQAILDGDEEWADHLSDRTAHFLLHQTVFEPGAGSSEL